MLMGFRWGLTWWTLPTSGGACCGPVRPPALSWGGISVHGISDQKQLPGSPAGRRCPGFYSRLFLVPKKTGHLRPVMDLSTLNQHLIVPQFKMETQVSVRATIRSQEWTVSIDIKDAYLHVLMHRALKKFLRFVLNKKTFQFTCLPIGLATSPQEFTKLLWPVVALLRQRGMKLQIYLDDWPIRTETPDQALLHARPRMTIRLLQHLGWVINFEKSNLMPSQYFQFIGMQVDTVAPLQKMCLKVQSVHQHWMTNPVITAHDLHRLLGMVVFMATLVPQGRLRLRPVQWWAATAWCQRTGNWSDRITVPQWVLSEVAWWSSPTVCRIYLSPPGRRKWLSSRMHPTRVGEPC